MEKIIPKNEVKIIEKTKTKNIFRNILRYALKPLQKGSLKIYENGDLVFSFGNAENNTENTIHAVIQVHNPRFYKRTVLFGDIGFAESYMDGDWDTDSIQKVISWFLLNVENAPANSGSKRFFFHIKLMNSLNKLYHLFRANTISGSKKNISDHYDIGNEFYKLFLDPTMTYSSAYYKTGNESLQEAQIQKYENICQNLKINSSHHILEIGSGWGGFSLYVAKKYGSRITTITISEEQYKFAKELFKREKVDHLIDIQLKDYRKIEGKYDRIVSIEMLEAVGDAFFETYFKKCHEVLKPYGLLGIQVITSPDSRYEDFKKGVDFIQRYIFPGSLLPSIARLNQAINRTGDLHLYRVEEMSLSYARTLNEWLFNFEKNLQRVRQLGFNEKFIRMWRYYLGYCAAAFQMRNIAVMQMFYTRPNNLDL